MTEPDLTTLTATELTRRLDALTTKRERILCGEQTGDLAAIGDEITKVTIALTEGGDNV